MEQPYASIAERVSGAHAERRRRRVVWLGSGKTSEGAHAKREAAPLRPTAPSRLDSKTRGTKLL
jgi:hypothetical protein